jgi:tetratricopeptide (TPR) repeat protein
VIKLIIKKVLPLLLTVLYGWFVFTLWNHFSADESYVESKKLLQNGRYVKAIEQANKSIKKNPNEPRYYYGKAKILLASNAGADQQQLHEIVQNIGGKDPKNYAYTKLMLKAEGLNPKNLVTLRNLVPIYYFLATNDLNQPGSPDNLDPEYEKITKEFFTKVKNYSPNDVGLPVLTAKYEKRLGFDEMYNESIEKIRQLRPDLPEWHPNIIE